MSGARSRVDCPSDVVPDFGESLPLVDEDRAREVCQNRRVSGDDFTLTREAEIDDGCCPLQGGCRLANTLRTVD
ncbi:hypothetical protein GCM10027063_09490 [Promicromonospora xylanilytica]